MAHVSYQCYNVGRSPSIGVNDFEVQLPVIIPKQDQQPWYDHHERLLSSKPRRQPGWSSTTFHWSARLAMIANDLYGTM